MPVTEFKVAKIKIAIIRAVAVLLVCLREIGEMSTVIAKHNFDSSMGATTIIENIKHRNAALVTTFLNPSLSLKVFLPGSSFFNVFSGTSVRTWRAVWAGWQAVFWQPVAGRCVEGCRGHIP